MKYLYYIGLHVRLNFETGVREAKLMTSEDAEDDNSAVVVVEEGESVTVISSDEKTGQREAFTEEEEERDRNIWGQFSFSHKPNPHISLSDHQEFERNLAYALTVGLEEKAMYTEDDDSTSELTKSSYDDEGPDALLLSALKNIEDFAHEIDFGIKIADPDTITSFLAILGSHPHPQVRALSARIIGSSLRNNAPALDISAPARVVNHLISALEAENNSDVHSRIMFALASSIHGRYGRQEYWSQKGGATLRRIFFSDGVSEDYIGRCGTFVEDSFVDDMMNLHQSTSSEQEAEMQREMGLWCAAFQDALAQDKIVSTDTREKIFSALSAIKSRYPTYCPVQDSFRSWISEKMVQRGALRKQQHSSDTKEKSNLLAASGISESTLNSDAEIKFLDKLSGARHSLFGNPKARRKAFDEL